jgi:16S rRNA (guanine1207-N2)-methyltransferase
MLLVRTLRERPTPVGETLDFGCGPGFLSAAVRALAPKVRIVSQDRDALALEALRENVPDAVPLLSERVDAARAQAPEGFALIVSNPPFHDGRDRTGAVWAGLVELAPKRLGAGGELRLVAQRNVRIEGLLRAHFAQVEALVLTPRFAVWSARR